MIKIALTSGVLFLVLGTGVAPVLPARCGMSGEASGYFNYAFDLMQQYSLHRMEIDWVKLRSQASVYVRDAQTTQDTYPAIVFACTHLKEYRANCLAAPVHTPPAIEQRSNALQAAAERAAFGRRLTSMTTSPFRGRQAGTLTMLEHGNGTYAYFVVPVSMRLHGEIADAHFRHKWAETLYGQVDSASRRGAQGWILDLRGADSWASFGPIFAGLQPLLGNGRILNFRSADSRHTTAIKDGKVLEQVHFASPYVEERIDEAVNLNPQQSPVAILIDHGTQGAAEVVAIAFKGRRRTLLIGERTGGFVDSGASWTLSDGAVLNIVTEQVFDRHGHSYSEGVGPDFQVDDPPVITTITQDPAVVAAEDWLAKQSPNPVR